MGDVVGDFWIETFSGKQISYVEPDVNQICIEDISHALAHICRFNGHSVRMYSVAEHCCLMADYAASTGKYHSYEVIEVLMHDAAEAYITDIPRPLKLLLPDFKLIEERLEIKIAKRFNMLYPRDPYIKELDNRILLDEREQVMNKSQHHWNLIGATEPLGVEVRFWTPYQAKLEFMNRFEHHRGMENNA